MWCDSLPSCALKAVHHYCHLSHVEIRLPNFYFPATFNDDNTTAQLAKALLYKCTEIELWTRTRKGIPRIRLRKLQLSGFLSCYLWFAQDKEKTSTEFSSLFIEQYFDSFDIESKSQHYKHVLVLFSFSRSSLKRVFSHEFVSSDAQGSVKIR